MREDRRWFAAGLFLAFANTVTFLFQTAPCPAQQEAFAPPRAPRENLTLRWISHPSDTKKAIVELSGLSENALERLAQWRPAEWRRLFAVYAQQGDLSADLSVPAMLGNYRIENRTVRFEPQFPLVPRVSYKAVVYPDQVPGEKNSAALISAAFSVAPVNRSKQATVVSHIYPSADLLPENLLKFYVHFSAPMSRGNIYEHIHLRDGSGKDIELPFLEIDEELWDPTMTRLTLFIDPGRIKRGVRPLEEVGPAMEAGKRYTLVIDRAWKDGEGDSLEKNFGKVFQVGPPDRTPPDPGQWKIRPPKGDEPLLVSFPEPLDHALAERVIQVVGQAGDRVEGRALLDDNERRWRFVPARPWSTGSYAIVVQTTIEDLAGNNIGKPFEVDLIEPAQTRLAHPSVRLPFVVR